MEALLKQRADDLLDANRPSEIQFEEHSGCGTVVDENIAAAMERCGLSEAFTKDELKRAYKRLAISCHPDKPGGSSMRFNQVKADCRLLKSRTTRPAMSLQQMVAEREEGLRIKKGDGKDFNKKFEATHAKDHAAHGHDDWFKSEIPTGARAPERVEFKDFDNVFQKYNTQKTRHAITKHVVTYLPSSNMACADLCGDGDDSVFNGNGYSDLKSAYAEGILS